MTYYNTTNESGRTLAEYQRAAENQQEAIQMIFERFQRPLTPSQVHAVMSKDTPITSVRRAITNLTNEGILTKLNDKQMGVYGRPEHLWVLTPSMYEGQTYKLDL